MKPPASTQAGKGEAMSKKIPKCRYCDKSLGLWNSGDVSHGRGFCGQGFFCSIVCGYDFAVMALRETERRAALSTQAGTEEEPNG